jgi:membrane associated rhomboid family serine protease
MASQQFDINRFVGSIPIVTKIFLAVNIGIHALIFLLSLNIGEFAISANEVLYRQEYYRIITSAFVHSGIMHIFFNMSTLLQLGVDLELQFGSLSFLFLSLWSVLVIGWLYISLSWTLSYMTGDPSYRGTSAVGYSGVLFTYAVIEAFHAREATRSIFGFFSVPSKIYPFILLIILQVIIPGISFFGHFSGVLFGLAICSGMAGLFIPTTETLTIMESWSYCGLITHNSSFARDTGKSYTVAEGTASFVCNGIAYIATFVINLIYAIFHMIGCPIERCVDNTKLCYQNIVSFVMSLCSRPANVSHDSSTSSQAFSGSSHRLVEAIATISSSGEMRTNGDYQAVPTDEESAPRGIAMNKIASPSDASAFHAVKANPSSGGSSPPRML